MLADARVAAYGMPSYRYYARTGRHYAEPLVYTCCYYAMLMRRYYGAMFSLLRRVY